MSLSTKCMIITMSMSRWSGCKVDPKASQKLAQDLNAQDGATIVSKQLMPKEAFSDIVTAYNALKAHRDRYSLPWNDNGARIMTRNIYELFMSGYGEKARAYEAAVEEFVTVKYPPVRDKAAFRMGELFDVKDYPTPDELREKFKVNLDIDGLTEPDDFRVVLPEAELQKVKSDMEESINRRLGSAMQDVYVRIAKVLEHYIEKIEDNKAIFRDSTVNKLVELMNILPGLNVVGDPKLKEIRKRIMDTFGSYQPDELRKQDDLRAAAAEGAKKIRDEITVHMNGG